MGGRSESLSRHAMLLLTNGGALRGDTENGWREDCSLDFAVGFLKMSAGQPGLTSLLITQSTIY